MHNLDEYVPWIKMRIPKVETMAVSHALNILVVSYIGEVNHGKYMGDVVHVYEMTNTSLQKAREFVVDGKDGSCCTKLMFTAENLLVMGYGSGEVCLIDTSAQCQVGFVGDPHGYCQPRHTPMHVAAKPGCIVIAYETTENDFMHCVRIFKGAHTTWTLCHVVKKLVEGDMCFFETTGLLAVLGTQNRDIEMEVVEMYRVDPWELTGVHCIGKREDDTVARSVREYDGEWFVRRVDGTLSVTENVHGNSKSKYQGTLTFQTRDDWDYHTTFIGYDHYTHANGIIEVCNTGLRAGERRVSSVTVYAHPDAIAMATMSELRVAWICAVVKSF